MSSAARKARKRAGIPYSKPQKTATTPYKTRTELYEDRRADRVAAQAVSGMTASLVESIRRSARRAFNR